MRKIEILDGLDKDSVCTKVPLCADVVGAEIETESEGEMSNADSDDEEI